MVFQRRRDRKLRISRVISPSGIKVVYAFFKRVFHHFGGLVVIGASVVAVNSGQAHTAKPQRRELFAVKVVIYQY